MSSKREVVVALEEVLLLLPSNLFNEIFLPFPQNYRGGSYHDRKPRMWRALNSHSSIERPSDDASSHRIKSRGTGVFLPERPVNSSQEKSPKKPPSHMISHSRQVFLPKEWAY